MAAKQIEGQKPSFFSRMGTGLTSFAVRNFSRGTAAYSLGYGIAAGIVVSGFVYAGRTLSILCFDHEYYKLQSRKRYYEKQLLFMREQEEAANAQAMAALSAEYDPVATRMPFRALDPKYRF